MRPMKIEVDERNASDVAELVASKVRNREAAGKGGTEKSGDDHLGDLKLLICEPLNIHNPILKLYQFTRKKNDT